MVRVLATGTECLGFKYSLSPEFFKRISLFIHQGMRTRLSSGQEKIKAVMSEKVECRPILVTPLQSVPHAAINWLSDANL